MSFLSRTFGGKPHQKPLPKTPIQTQNALAGPDVNEASPLSGRPQPSKHSSAAGNRPNKTLKKRRGTTRRWLLEILACCGALLALMAVAIFLSQYNGRPRPQWPYTITINTVVSIFGLMLKACMLVPVAEGISQLKWLWFSKSRPLIDLDKFDGASRGVTGSMNLIVAGARHLAVVGAVITLLAVLIDPMLQQTISYYDAPHDDLSVNATVPVARGYMSNDFNGTSTFDESLMGAVYDSLLSPGNSRSTLSADCPSGNCTFPRTYESLGICSACTNITPFMLANFTLTTNVTITGVPYEALMLTVNFPTDGTAQEKAPRFYLTPAAQGPAINITSQAAPNSLFNLTEWNTPFIAGSRTVPNVTMHAASDPFFDIWSISVTRDELCTSGWMDGGPAHGDTDCLDPTKVDRELNISGITLWPSGNFSLDGELAFLDPIDDTPTNFTQLAMVPITAWPKLTGSLCTLSFCTQTYQSEVVSGRLREKKLSEGSMLMLLNDSTTGNNQGDNVFSSLASVYVPETCVVNGSAHSINDFVDMADMRGSEILMVPHSGYGYKKRSSSLTAESQRIDKREGRSKTSRNWPLILEHSPDRGLLEQCAYPVSALGLTDALQDAFHGAGFFTTFPLNATQKATDINPWSLFTETQWAANHHLVSLFNGGNYSTTSMRYAFDDLATAMTNHMRQYSGIGVSGVAQSNQTYVQVMFEWLILPAVLVVASCIFLIVIMMKARKNMGQRIWKSSQTALMMHGLHDRDRYGPLVNTEDMESFSKTTKVRLGLESAGWRLVKEQKFI